jgi:hypothetical protein
MALNLNQANELVQRLFTDEVVEVYESSNPQIMSQVALALRQDTVCVKHLRLLGGLERKGALALQGALKANKTLEQLTAFWVDEEECLTALLLGVAQSSLKKLSIHYSAVCAQDIQNLDAALPSNTRLVSLDLTDNRTLGNDGAAALAKALCGPLRRLKELYLWDCGIESSGAVALARALVINKCLQILDMYGNYIGDEGASAIADALARNQALTDLILSDCGIGNEGAAALGEGLETNNHLERLSLERNKGISEQGKQALNNGTIANTNLVHLGLAISKSKPSLHPVIDEQITCSLKMNRFRRKCQTQNYRSFSPGLMPHIFAGVSNKASTLFLFLQENEHFLVQEGL